MDRTRGCDGRGAASADWMAGYEAVIQDAIQLIDRIGGQGCSNLTSPVLIHLKVRLAELRAEERKGAA
jgi:hypothetical protein